MTEAASRARSLTHHVALDCWRRGHGNGRLVNELIRVTYMAWFLQRAGYGEEPLELFKAAERIAEVTLMKAHESGHEEGWPLDAEAVSIFTGLLALHDAQLGSAPLHQFENAERHLLTFLQGAERSPIPAPAD